VLYSLHTEAELRDEFARLKRDYASCITRWKAGDTEVEKEKSNLTRQLSLVVAEIRQRPGMEPDARPRYTRTRAVFS
jgi:hypothetical protein